VADVENFFTRALTERDLVFFAQRGTAYSEPHLTCDAASEAYFEALFAGQSFDDVLLAEIDALKTCHDDYVASGIDFEAFNSVEIASDADSIREVFGYDQIIYYGESYGTLLGQHFMRQYPDTLAAVILDGVIPISTLSWAANNDAKFRRVLDYVTDLCASDAACSTAYPDFTENIESVYEQLNAEPITLSYDDNQDYELTGDLYAIATFDAMYASLFVGLLPNIVDNLANGEADVLTTSIMEQAFPREGIAWLMHYAVVIPSAR